jgi:hypothetical protein
MLLGRKYFARKFVYNCETGFRHLRAEGAQKSGQTEEVVAVQMGYENLWYFCHSQITLLNLDLRPLSAVEQPDLTIFKLEGGTRDPASRGRKTGRGSKKRDFHRKSVFWGFTYTKLTGKETV